MMCLLQLRKRRSIRGRVVGDEEKMKEEENMGEKKLGGRGDDEVHIRRACRCVEGLRQRRTINF